MLSFRALTYNLEICCSHGSRWLQRVLENVASFWKLMSSLLSNHLLSVRIRIASRQTAYSCTISLDLRLVFALWEVSCAMLQSLASLGLI